MLRKLKKEFKKIYPDNGYELRKFFSPGRVNIIGEHTDYNGGFVLPCAIEIGTYGVARKNDDGLLRLKSLNFPNDATISLNDLKYNESLEWINYPLGVIKYMREEGYKVGGLDIIIFGNIPIASGLSSSASLELLIGEMMNQIYNDGMIEKTNLALIGQRTEKEFLGLNSGIMDQLIIANSKENSACLIDTNALSCQYVPLNIGDNNLIILNTNSARQLVGSKYNDRKKECEQALSILQKNHIKIDNLCQIGIDNLDWLDLIEDNIVKNRAEHVVRENDRVLKAKESLEMGNVEELGSLLRASNESLKELYEVTGPNLDSITYHANNFPQCLGARMTGAGFGGCAIAIVKKDFTEEFKKYVSIGYKADTGIDPQFILCKGGNGVCEVIT